MNDTERKFDNLIKALYHVMFTGHNHNLINSEYVICVQKAVRILDKIKNCDETSATKCYTTINQIKDLINRSNLL